MTLPAQWSEGVKYFNEGKYWEAHEAWERGWVQLDSPIKSYVQSLIQVAAIFYLMSPEGGKRESAARRLARSALAKSNCPPHLPRIEIPGRIEFLTRLCSEADIAETIAWGRQGLRAIVIYS